MADTWASWLEDRMPQAQKDLMAATEAREAREWEAEQAEKRDREDTARRMAQVAENATIYRYGHTSAELREAAQNATAVRELRNMQSEYGSAERAAGFVVGAGGQLITMQPREQTRPGTWRADPEAELLKRSRAAGDNEFMRQEVARFDARRRAAGKPVMSRSYANGHGDGLACVECAAEGLTEDESFKVHNDPQFGAPIPPVTVPDYAPTRSRRSGTARKTPMIYR